MTHLMTCLKVWLKWLDLTWLAWWPACLPFIIIGDFCLPPVMWPIPVLLPKSLSMTVVLQMPTFFAIALIDSLWFSGKLSLAFPNTWAWFIFSAFHCWFRWFLWDILSCFYWGVGCFLPFFPFALNFSFAIILTLKKKLVEWPTWWPLWWPLWWPH